MRGYYFINTRLLNKRAHSIQILNTIEGINASGGNLILVAPSFKEGSDYDVFKYYGIEKPFQIKKLFVFWQKRASKVSFVLFSITAVIYLFSQIIQKKVDYIYIRSDFFYPLLKIASVFNIPYFYEIHRLGRNKKRQKVKEKLAKDAKGLITITENLKDKFSGLNKNILVAHDGVNLSRFGKIVTKEFARKKFGIPPDQVICLYLGTISKTKGSDIIINNASRLPGVTFYLVGIQKLDLPKNLPGNVVIKTSIDQKDVPLFQQIADVLILTNPESIYSQSPIKLFEYMASGRPIISSDLKNIREVLNNKNSLFYKPENDDSYVKILKEYISKREKYNAGGLDNLNIVKNYTWKERGLSISKFINKIVRIQ